VNFSYIIPLVLNGEYFNPVHILPNQDFSGYVEAGVYESFCLLTNEI
jgi:hypothetical protein